MAGFSEEERWSRLKKWLEEGTKKNFEKEKCWVGFGEEERMYVKKKEREKINLIKEGETNQLKPFSFSFFLRYNA